MGRYRSAGAVLCVAVGLASCGEATVAGVAQRPAYDVNGAGHVPAYNGGVDRAVPASPCREDGVYRQLDFILGRWTTTRAAGTVGGTNVLTSVLDGCAVAENWIAPNGAHGRSLTSYDRDDGRWHQTWVADDYRGHLRMAGGLQAADMVLHGVRTQRNGVEWIDDYRWHPLDADHFVQSFSLTIPAANFQTGGALTYARDDGLVQQPARTTNPVRTCAAGGPLPEARQLDFWVGDWQVSAEHGPVLGTAHVAGDLVGCLVEERYETDKGYAAVSFSYVDVVEERWYRTYLDSEGERIELRGDLDGDGRVVMTGTERAPGGRSYQLRVTLEPVDASTVRQTWETSDDGATWTTALALRYSRL